MHNNTKCYNKKTYRFGKGYIQLYLMRIVLKMIKNGGGL